MVFASLVFLYLFLPVSLVLLGVARQVWLRNLWLTALSLLFYAWGEPVWIVLLMISASVDYVIGLVIARTRGRPWARVALVASLVVNLSLLAAFKYMGWCVGMIERALAIDLDVPEVALPIGISFYTFQTISYVVDVYRGEVPAQRSYLQFLMFVSMFPQLVAGPIVRYKDVEPELRSRPGGLADVSAGLGRFCIGLFKKVAIANVAAELVARYMDADPGTLSIGEAWFGLAMFTLQIYFDFSGYSDMAIGLGQCFGFRFPENFRHPYVARSVVDFWRRWHISLSSFFRDYVYIPLGGNRHHAMRNLFVVWLLTGLWHGASTNFVLWGLWFGIWIAIERAFAGRLLERAPRLVAHTYLLAIVVLSWLIFYFDDMPRLLAYARLLFAIDDDAPGTGLAQVIFAHAGWLVFAVVACTPVRAWFGTRVLAAIPERDRGGMIALERLVTSMICLFVATAMLVGNTYNPFLYFRF
jgi:alginate O-acetyltransferase complex protein AlgI